MKPGQRRPIPQHDQLDFEELINGFTQFNSLSKAFHIHQWQERKENRQFEEFCKKVEAEPNSDQRIQLWKEKGRAPECRSFYEEQEQKRLAPWKKVLTCHYCKSQWCVVPGTRGRKPKFCTQWCRDKAKYFPKSTKGQKDRESHEHRHGKNALRKRKGEVFTCLTCGTQWCSLSPQGRRPRFCGRKCIAKAWYRKCKTKQEPPELHKRS